MRKACSLCGRLRLADAGNGGFEASDQHGNRFVVFGGDEEDERVREGGVLLAAHAVGSDIGASDIVFVQDDDHAALLAQAA